MVSGKEETGEKDDGDRDEEVPSLIVLKYLRGFPSDPSVGGGQVSTTLPTIRDRGLRRRAKERQEAR